MIKLAIAVFLVALGSFLLGNSFNKTPINLTQTESSAEVDVSASYSGNFQFEIALNTHSVDLSNFDFSQSVILKTKNYELKSISATPVSDSPPHHRTFTLTFPKFNLPVTLIINNLGGTPERKLIFERG